MRVAAVILSVVTLVSALAFGGRAAEALHPQDGPHVDLGFELRADAFVAEVSMNLVFLDHLLEPTREQPDRLELGELASMREALRRRMGEVCRVTIDGVAPDPASVPEISGLAVNDPDESLVPLFPKSGMRGLRKLKFELRWPVAAPPKSVSIVWSAYPPDELSTIVPPPPLSIAAELSAEGVRSQLEFRENEPEFVWRPLPGDAESRLLTVPAPVAAAPVGVSALTLVGAVVGVASLALAFRRSIRRRMLGVGGVALGVAALGVAYPVARVEFGGGSLELPTTEEAVTIFRPLHENLYRAFDFTEESAIYDALARSVHGPLLEDLYLTIHRSLVMQEEGGALSRVRAVRELAVDVESIGLVPAADGDGLSDVPGFSVVCRYQVDGRVTHWGHSHDRTNEYRTRYVVVARDGVWRIAETLVLEQARVDGLPETRPDGSFDI